MEIINGKRLAIERHGAGDPILMVHGLGGTSNAWGPQANALAQKFTVIRPDLEGSGRSPITGALSIEGLVDDLVAILDAFEIKCAHLAGHSMGTILCQHLVMRHPGRVLSMALLGPLAAPPEAARTPIRDRAALARTEGLVPIADAIVQGATSQRTKTDRPEVVAFIRELILRQDPEGYAGTCEALADAQAADVSKVTCPILLLTGDEDAVAPPDAVKELGVKFTSSRVEILGDCGHWTPLEQAAAVTSRMESFFTS